MTSTHTTVYLACLAAALIVGLILVVVHRWLDYESARSLARIRRTPRVVHVPVDSTDTEQALRRELYVARTRIADLTGQLNAARQMARQRERATLALSTLRAEEDQTNPIVLDPTMTLPATPARARVRLEGAS